MFGLCLGKALYVTLGYTLDMGLYTGSWLLLSQGPAPQLKSLFVLPERLGSLFPL